MNFVALDIGNVLVHVDFQVFIDALSKQLNLTFEEAEYFMNRTHALHDVGLTKMADELRDHFKIKSPLLVKELLISWNTVIKPNFSIINKLIKMKDTCDLQIALLSNVGLEHAAQMKQMLGEIFTDSIKHLSCYVGARKPTKLYYQSFLQQHPEFYGCAYLDDLQENLNMGAEFGFRPFLFDLSKERYIGDLPTNVYVRNSKLQEIEQFILYPNTIGS